MGIDLTDVIKGNIRFDVWYLEDKIFFKRVNFNMSTRFKSTRGDKNYVSASQAIVKGIAADGGLFLSRFRLAK